MITVLYCTYFGSIINVFFKHKINVNKPKYNLISENTHTQYTLKGLINKIYIIIQAKKFRHPYTNQQAESPTYLWSNTKSAPMLVTSSRPSTLPAVPTTFRPARTVRLVSASPCRLVARLTQRLGDLHCCDPHGTAGSMHQQSLALLHPAPEEAKTG